MPHSSNKLLQDILSAGQAIQQFTVSRTLDDYRNDLMLRSAVERQFEIIGEALNRLGRLNPASVQNIEGHEKIIAFRNVVAHGYDVLDDAIVWQMISDYLPELLAGAAASLQQGENT